ncbi:hypothetical protein MTP10_23600 [Nonomuraea sp. 3-1Str]|uniref:hypothetical protein n=1 Tax=Nonomuraea sp. 3-1Str TaxID=2929801 RepID=UPI0028583E16|nr:hypothetical protein [Nonomuraea sp. 3-1Str]MDR8411707.1 hypothetical protein [Nonomuraea sp. 3-1Str]
MPLSADDVERFEDSRARLEAIAYRLLGPFSDMFAGTGVVPRLATVTGVDVDRKTVTVTDANGAARRARL